MAIFLIANAILVWFASSPLERRLAAIREAGDPLSIADLLDVEAIPPEQNAAVYLRRARDANRAIRKELDALYMTGHYDEWHPTEAELTKIGATFDAHPDVIPLLKEAAACDNYVPEFDAEERSRIGSPPVPDQFLQLLLPRVSAPREAARTLHDWAVWQDLRKNHDEALDACTTLVRLSRHFEHEPLMTGYLVANACRGIAVDTANHVLRSAPVSDAARQALDQELARCDGVEGYRRALETERAFGLDSFRSLPLGNSWLGGAYWGREKLAYLDAIEQRLNDADRPFYALSANGNQSNAAAGVLVNLFIPALDATRLSMEQSRARARALRVLSALQRRPEPDKMPAADLSDLGLPKDATVDPFTGKRLRVEKLPGGWLVYSVGRDLKDDGGIDLDGYGQGDVGLRPIADKPEEPEEPQP